MEFFWNKVLTIYPNSQGGFMKETYQELKYVVDNSMYVKINYNKIVEFAQELKTPSYKHWFADINIKVKIKKYYWLL